MAKFYKIEDNSAVNLDLIKKVRVVQSDINNGSNILFYFNDGDMVSKPFETDDSAKDEFDKLIQNNK